MSQDRVNEVAYALVGTRDELHDHADHEEMRDPHFMADLNEKTRRCDDCRSWFDPEECIIEDDEVICGDCWDA